MVRVLHVSNSGDVAGGAERSLIELLVQERSLGVEPTVLVPHAGSLVGELQRLGVPVIQMRYFPWLEWAEQPQVRRRAVRLVKNVWNAIAERRIERLLRRTGFDVIHINTSATSAGTRSAKKLGIPVVWHVREFNSAVSGRVFAHPRRQMSQIARADVVLAVSDVVARQYRSFPHGALVRVIYDAVEGPELLRDVSDILRFPPYQLVVVGSVMAPKGQLEALRALKRVTEGTDHRPVLTLVGPLVDPAYETEIKSFIRDAGLSDQVRLTGEIGDVYAELLLTDILIVSSRSESFGRATVEGMLAGCLVIGARNTGTEELLAGGRGLLYERGSEGLAQQITAAFGDIEGARETASQGQAFGRGISDGRRSATEIVELFEEARHVRG
jgi:hypothetical protein